MDIDGIKYPIVKASYKLSYTPKFRVDMDLCCGNYHSIRCLYDDAFEHNLLAHQYYLLQCRESNVGSDFKGSAKNVSAGSRSHSLCKELSKALERRAWVCACEEDFSRVDT